ncbi:MAG: M23 family metallopeptidase [Leptospiraceae bacterium]|nr:M23 family metallopeptidase [Leptospiraceae bacterium]
MWKNFETPKLNPDQIKQRLQKKFSERLTIMLIPHGNEKIYSIHISFLVLVFLLGLFVFLIIVGLNAYLRYKEISQKIEELQHLYGKNYQFIFYLQKALMEIQNYNKHQINKNIQNIYEVIQIPSSKLKVDFSDISEIVEEKINKEISEKKELPTGFKYIKATYIAYNIKEFLQLQTDVLRKIEKLQDKKIDFVYSIPNGRPVYRVNDTSGYGIRLDPVTRNHFEFHTGMDMAGSYGDPILATADGYVYKVFYDPGYGNTVILKHPSGYYTLYAHLSRALVQTNQRVYKGQAIALMGLSGRTTGVHLHYEVQLPNQDRVNPISFVCLTDLLTSKCKRYNRNFEED